MFWVFKERLSAFCFMFSYTVVQREGLGGRRAKCSVKRGTFCYYLQVENPRNKIHHIAPLDCKNETKSVISGFANPQGQEIQRMLSTCIFRDLKQTG